MPRTTELPPRLIMSIANTNSISIIMPCQKANEQKTIAITTTELTDDTSSPITNLIVLTLTDLYQQLGDLVLDLHLAEDRRSVVGHGDIAVGRDEDLVQSSWSEGGFDDVGDWIRDRKRERLC
jgi:hypothetical protein